MDIGRITIPQYGPRESRRNFAAGHTRIYRKLFSESAAESQRQNVLMSVVCHGIERIYKK